MGNARIGASDRKACVEKTTHKLQKQAMWDQQGGINQVELGYVLRLGPLENFLAIFKDMKSTMWKYPPKTQTNYKSKISSLLHYSHILFGA